jgi:hypothetical protein
MDLIDMQSLSYNDYRYIVVYQDQMTKFVVLRPLKSKGETDVAMQILDIFLLFGAPNILQSDNGAEFTATLYLNYRIYGQSAKSFMGSRDTHKPGKC